MFLLLKKTNILDYLKTMFRYLKFPFISLALGLAAAGLLSWLQVPTFTHVVQTLLTVLLLSILEISLSFDNAIVNATVIKKMSPLWKTRFLFWGMLVAVFGMRILFPVMIVAAAGSLNVIDAFLLAIQKPDLYSQMMLESHLAVSSFGGAFLLMVSLNFFMNEVKETHWISWIEKIFVKLAKFKGGDIILVLAVLMVIYAYLDFESQATFIKSALYGMLTYLFVHGFSELLGNENLTRIKWLSSGFGLFLYLEVLDASFSFDGVIGAFAITTQIYEIIIGLGVGAFFVRGLTLYLVEEEKLEQYEFLEHGAFYALLMLALFMLLDHFFHFTEWITALTGAIILLLSVLYSIHTRRQQEK
ncbi:MAG: DUF475 domain-containing protein [Pseudobdellovibrio sp.]